MRTDCQWMSGFRLTLGDTVAPVVISSLSTAARCFIIVVAVVFGGEDVGLAGDDVEPKRNCRLTSPWTAGSANPDALPDPPFHPPAAPWPAPQGMGVCHPCPTVPMPCCQAVLLSSSRSPPCFSG
jgi:hypothetical protein